MSDPIQSSPSTLPKEPRPVAEEYQPLSGLALGAIGVAVLFAMVMVALGITAFASGKPVVWPALLLLPVIGLVLAIMARVQINRSAGTRAGLGLSSAAWWICVLGGVVYTAYLMGNIFAIGRESRLQADKWFENVKDEDYGEAFVSTLEPGIRGGVEANDLPGIEARFGTSEWPGFRYSAFVQMCERNRGDVVIEHDARSDLQQTQTGYEVAQRYELRCPEGIFIIPVQLVASESDDFDTRQWQVKFGRSMLTEPKPTEYGRMIIELTMSGAQTFELFIRAAQLGNLSLARELTKSPSTWAMSMVFPQLAAGATPGQGQLEDPDAFFTSKFFRTPDNTPPSPAAVQFLQEAWLNRGFTSPGGPDRVAGDDSRVYLDLESDQPAVRVSTAVVVRNQAGTQFIKGRLVTVCRDPKILERLRKAREAGKSDPTVTYDSDLSPFEGIDSAWYVERMESNFQIRAMTELDARGPQPGGEPGL